MLEFTEAGTPEQQMRVHQVLLAKATTPEQALQVAHIVGADTQIGVEAMGRAHQLGLHALTNRKALPGSGETMQVVSNGQPEEDEPVVAAAG